MPTAIRAKFNLEDKVPPLLRWAGSKRKLLFRLTELVPKTYGKYIEPFAGSAALYFELLPPRAILSDINAPLMEMYEEVRKHPNGIFHEVQKIPIGPNHYYRLRGECEAYRSRKRRAAAFIYLNRYCFNGLYRTNKAGHFNVPYGGLRNGYLPTQEHLRAVARALINTKLITSDFENVVQANVRRGDFVYLDPPYATGSGRSFDYYGGSFSTLDLGRLSDTLRHIDRVGAHFVLSYAYTDEARALASRWQLQKVSVLRNIAGFSNARRKSAEAVITNLAA